MQPETVDYALLRDHICGRCNQSHRLAALPVDGGWNVGVRCGCTRNGHVVRYSTESETYPTFDAAEVAISWLLHPTSIRSEEVRPERNVNWDKSRRAWKVQFKRGSRPGTKFTVGYFTDHAQAIKARDEFLNELEAA